MNGRSEEYREGYYAYLDGESRDKNPYPCYADESLNTPHDDWNDGWNEAAWDD